MKRNLIGLAAALLAASAFAQTADNPNNIVETYEVAQNTNGPATTKAAPAAPSESGSFLGMRMPRGPIAYPGNTWGTLVYGAVRPTGDTSPRWRVEGIVEQGADWFRFGADNSWKFNTYVAAEYVLNDIKSSWTPVIGAKVNKRFTDGSLDLGVRYKYGNTYLSPTGTSSFTGEARRSRVEVYATYWFDWNLKKD